MATSTWYNVTDSSFIDSTTHLYWPNQTESLRALNSRYAAALVPFTVTFGFFVVFGFIGNLIIILVFFLSRDYRRNNFKIFVLTLAVIDILTCVTLIPAEMVKHRHYFAFGDAASCKTKCFFNVFGAAASCLALLVISVDRYRKVVQPFKTQMTPQIALRVLFVVAFIFPVLLAIPGTIMCGIKTTNMTNIDGGETEIHLCETEDKFRNSIWRVTYKYTFIILLVGISFTYLVLYAFVMKEAIKQIKAIASLRRASSRELGYVSSVYRKNSVHVESNKSNKCQPNVSKSVNLSQPVNESQPINVSQPVHISTEEAESSVFDVAQPLPTQNGSFRREDTVTSQTRQFTRNQTSMQSRHKFPTKTLVWFILTIVFIISYMTHIILALKVADIVNMTPNEFAWFSFCFRIYFVNHMINPLVYAIFVKKFRDSCSAMIPRLKDKIRNHFT